MTNELPEIKKVDSVPPTYPTSKTIVFENGAQLRYRKTDDGIVEEVFAPSDPHSVMESSTVVPASQPATVDEVASESIDYYEEYETVEQLKQDWTNLAEWINHE